jgi:hypothetical protein
MYRLILSNIKEKIEKNIKKSKVWHDHDKSMHEGYCDAMNDIKHIIEEYEKEADAIIKYFDGETGQWLPGAPYKYRFRR